MHIFGKIESGSVDAFDSALHLYKACADAVDAQEAPVSDVDEAAFDLLIGAAADAAAALAVIPARTNAALADKIAAICAHGDWEVHASHVLADAQALA